MTGQLITILGGKAMGKVFVASAIAALAFAFLNSYLGLVVPSSTGATQ